MLVEVALERRRRSRGCALAGWELAEAFDVDGDLLADPAARYTDLGPGYYQARTDKDKRINNHIRQIEALLGHPITITPEAA